MKRRAILICIGLLLLAIGYQIGRSTTDPAHPDPETDPGAVNVVNVRMLAPDEAPSGSRIDPADPATAAPSSLQPTRRQESKPPERGGSDEEDLLWIEHRREDFALKHGIQPETVTIQAPTNEQELREGLTGTVWGWGANPGSDQAWVIFLGDGTLYGSWGFRYRYSVDPDTLEIIWAEHRTRFSETYRYLQTEGRHPRVGMLLKRVEGQALETFLANVEGMDLIHEDQNAVPDAP